jgi:hypothetical protein
MWQKGWDRSQHSEKGTASSLIVASIPEVSFWPDDNSSPGNYGWLFLFTTLNLVYTSASSLSFPFLHILQFTETFCEHTCSTSAQFFCITKRATQIYEHTCSSSALCSTFLTFSPYSVRARVPFLLIFFYISHLVLYSTTHFSLSLSLLPCLRHSSPFRALAWTNVLLQAFRLRLLLWWNETRLSEIILLCLYMCFYPPITNVIAWTDLFETWCGGAPWHLSKSQLRVS